MRTIMIQHALNLSKGFSKSCKTALVARYAWLLSFIVISITGCKEQLEVLPNNEIVIHTVEEFEKMLNPRFGWDFYIALGKQVPMNDNFSWDAATYEYSASQSVVGTAGYMWEDQLFEPGWAPIEWEKAYKTIYQCNYILELIDEAPALPGNEWMRDQIKGEVLAFRANLFFELVNNYARHFHPQTAAQDPGINMPLINSDETSPRVSVAEVYDQVVSDLEEATILLRNNLPDKFLSPYAAAAPSKAAVYGLLSRVYLYMATDLSEQSRENLARSVNAANESLSLYNFLYDLNNENIPASNHDNKEIIWYKRNSWTSGRLFYSVTNPMLYPRLSDEITEAINPSIDMRFKNPESHHYVYGGYGDFTYNGPISKIGFSLTVPEIRLIKAEAEARLGLLAESAATLNAFRTYRYESGADFSYDPAGNKENMVAEVLMEKRIEMAMCHSRWWDQKRLILLGEYQNNITRTDYNGKTVTLNASPDEQKYVLEFPQYVKDFNPGLTNR